MLIQLCQEYQLNTPIVHLSSSVIGRPDRAPGGWPKRPSLLDVCGRKIPNGAVEYRCSPPIRERTNPEFLWAALAGGLIQSVVSDDQPPAAGSPPSNFLEGRGGIASIQLGLPIVWTGASARGYTHPRAGGALMSHAPARLVGLARKGSIDVGYDADLAVFDQDAAFTVESAAQSGPSADDVIDRAAAAWRGQTYLPSRDLRLRR